MNKATLIKAAEELNKVLGCDPPIDVEADETEIKKLITQAASLIEEGDKISKSTMKVIEKVKSEVPTETEQSEETIEATETETEQSEEDAGQSGESAEEETPAQDAKSPKKKGKNKDKKEAAKAPEKPVETTGMTRLQAAGIAIRDGGTGSKISALIPIADEMYVKDGGKSNLNVSKQAVMFAIQALTGFGAIEVTDNIIKIK